MSFSVFVRLFVLLCFLVGCSEPEVERSSSTDTPVERDLRPNILLIVADDLGYTDLGSFGGEINTPNLDNLAQEGIKLSRFYTTPTCAPTRAMLLSGVDHHRAGLGNMAETVAENQKDLPGYEGYLNNEVLTLAEVLRDSGYHTYMTGKWHLGLQYDQSPRARGFERSFASLFGASSHYSDRAGPDAHRHPALYRSDGELIETLQEGFYSSKDYTDQMLGYIDSQIDDGKPFFGYLAFTAPHWPLQAPEEAQTYQGVYDEGYDALRERRFEALKSQGLVSDDVQIPPRPASMPAWDQLPEEQQAVFIRNMEIYAAMVDYMDASIGRILSYLKTRDEYNNTLILFISDNGADPWGEQTAPKAITDWVREFDNSMENRGRVGSFAMYDKEGAWLSTSLFHKFKGSTAEGGIRVPAIISWPDRFESAATIERQPVSALDVFPTFLDAAGTKYPDTTDRKPKPFPPTGESILPFLGNSETSREFQFGLELWGMRAMIVDDWKLVNMPKPVGTGNWSLYNVVQDPAETQDLYVSEPEIAEQLLAAWDQYVETNNVVLPPWPPVVNEPGQLPDR